MHDSETIATVYFPSRINNEEEFSILQKSIDKKGVGNLAELLVQSINESKDRKRIIRKIQIGRDGLTASIRRIDASYNFSISGLDYNIDGMEIQCLLFFHYFKYLLEVLAYSFPEFKVNGILKDEITELRNIFAHSYNKDRGGKIIKHKPSFIRLDLNPQFFEGINIEIFDIDTPEKYLNVRFSLDYYYSEFGKLILILNEYIKNSPN